MISSVTKLVEQQNIESEVLGSIPTKDCGQFSEKIMCFSVNKNSRITQNTLLIVSTSRKKMLFDRNILEFV